MEQRCQLRARFRSRQPFAEDRYFPSILCKRENGDVIFQARQSENGIKDQFGHAEHGRPDEKDG